MKDLRHSMEAIFLVAVLLLSSGAFAPLWNDPSATNRATDGDPALQCVWAAIYCIVIVFLVPYSNHVLRLMVANKLLMLLTLLCIVSAAWSDDPSVSLRKGVALFGTTLVGLLLTVRFEMRGQLRLLTVALGLAALASLMVSLFCPQLCPPTELTPGAWNGVFSHKNLLGRAMSLGVVAFLSLDRATLPGILFAWSGAALCGAMLLASHSQTALVVVVAMIVVPCFSALLRWDWRQASASFLSLLLVALPLAWFASQHSDDLLDLLHRDATLTGRARIWTFAALSFARHRWLGYGYGAFWWVSNESRQTLALIRYPTPHAHNGLLDLGLQLGIVGIAVFLFGWLINAFAAVRTLCCSASREARWPWLYLLFLLFYTLTENSLLSPNSLLWILYVSACSSVTLNPIRSSLRSPKLVLEPSPI